jgi:hypothetical protein
MVSGSPTRWPESAFPYAKGVSQHRDRFKQVSSWRGGSRSCWSMPLMMRATTTQLYSEVFLLGRQAARKRTCDTLEQRIAIPRYGCF